MPNHAWRILLPRWVSRLALRTAAFSHALTLTLTTHSAYRWQKLVKRLKEEYDGAPPAPATTKTTKAKANGTKRKRSPRIEDVDDSESVGKKVKIDSEELDVKDEADAADVGDADANNSANLG